MGEYEDAPTWGVGRWQDECAWRFPIRTGRHPPFDQIAAASAAYAHILRGVRHHDNTLRDEGLAFFGQSMFAAAQTIHVPVARGLALKYPGACFRCGVAANCSCNPEALAQVPRNFQGDPRIDLVSQSLGAWQRFLDQLYGPANRLRGFYEVSAHLFEEVGEAAEAVARAGDLRINREAAQLEEFGDVFAWWLGLCTLLGRPADELLIRHVLRP